MARPVWEGHLRLSLVTCPVALFKATTEGATVHLHLLHPETHNRVKQAWKDPTLPDGEQEIPRGELLHGYELERGQYVIVEDADLKSVRLESTNTIQIERFVDAASIDRLYWDQPYFMTPSGQADLQEPFAVIRDAMVEAGRVALGRVVMTGRERTVAIEPRHGGLLLTTLRAFEEVRQDSEVFEGLEGLHADPAMIEIAQAIIGKQEGAFQPETFHDRYAEALKELIERKAAGMAVVADAEPAPESNVVDLMAALRASLKGSDVPQAGKPANAKAGPKRSAKPAAKPATAAKAAAGGRR
jgi:DNA end-binding protein Ku